MAKYLLIGLALGAGLYFRGKSAAASPVKTAAAATPAAAKPKTAAKPAQRKAPVKAIAQPPAATINDVRANTMLMVTGQEAGWLPKYQPNASKNKYRKGKAVK